MSPKINTIFLWIVTTIECKKKKPQKHPKTTKLFISERNWSSNILTAKLFFAISTSVKSCAKTILFSAERQAYTQLCTYTIKKAK